MAIFKIFDEEKIWPPALANMPAQVQYFLH